jgi:hypothetical protein
MNRLLILVLVTLSLLNSVQAGVVQRLVEVEPEEREALEQARADQQEEYQREAQEQIEQRTAPVLPVVTLPAVEPPQATVAASPEPRASTKHNSALCNICKSGGSLSGLFIGMPVGLVRGSAAKAAELAEVSSDSLGGGVIGKAIGIPGGAILGAVTGAVTGLAKGAVNGLRTGWSDPFSPESYSTDGDFLDYDPYAINE